MDRSRCRHSSTNAASPPKKSPHTYTDYREVARAIREMVIRGAPAIGVPQPWA